MKKTFAEVVLLARTGLNPRKNFKLGQGNNNYITIKNIKNNTLVIDENTDVVDDEAIKLIHKRSKIKKGDILFASIGRMGDMYIIEDDPVGWDINESVFAFTLDTNIVRQKYFYYIFRVKSTLGYLASNSSGSTFKSIKMNQLKKMTFDIPPLEKQDQIVATLDKVCNVIEMRKQELISLDDLIKARFVEMFGTLDNPAQKFEKATLKELCNKITDGKHGGCTSEEGTKRYFVGAREIYNDEVHYDTAPEINVDEFEKDYKRCNIEIGDFLIVNTGATIGKSAIASDERTEHTLLQKSVALLKVKQELLNPMFLKWCYRVNTRMYMVESASAQPNLLLSKINATEIYVPDMKLQNQFADFVHQVNKSKVAVQKALDETQLLFNSLMQEYFG